VPGRGLAAGPAKIAGRELIADRAPKILAGNRIINNDRWPHTTAMSQPPITFLVFAYKQEQFIREAVEGALAQTYSPLEIILSDDCSPDRTFEIMQEMAAAYRGPHKIVLNRNPKNLGLGSHLNRLMELASGEIIVIGAGDDISLPERVERIQCEFAASGGKAMAVFSDMTEIDATGNILKLTDTRPRPGFDHPVQCCRNMLEGIEGASNSWHRKVFDVFGPLQPVIVFEDRVIALRAALLGDIRHIPEPLVKYRRHQANTVAMFHSTDVKQARRTLEYFLSAYRNSACDLENFVQNIQPDFPEASQCRRMIRRRICKLESYLRIYSGSPGRMIRGLFGLALSGGNPLQGIKLCGRVLHSGSASSCP
jgi:glycosyltransferase involved in cell wall biosynthesis